MKTRVIGNKKVIVEWPEGEDRKAKKLDKKLYAAGMFDTEGVFEFWKKIKGKEGKWFRRIYECALSPEHDWLEETMEQLAAVGLCPFLSCEGKRDYEACYDDAPISRYDALDSALSRGATPRGAMIKAYKAWLKEGRYVNGTSLAELVAQ